MPASSRSFGRRVVVGRQQSRSACPSGMDLRDVADFPSGGWSRNATPLAPPASSISLRGSAAGFQPAATAIRGCRSATARLDLSEVHVVAVRLSRPYVVSVGATRPSRPHRFRYRSQPLRRICRRASGSRASPVSSADPTRTGDPGRRPERRIRRRLPRGCPLVGLELDRRHSFAAPTWSGDAARGGISHPCRGHDQGSGTDHRGRGPRTLHLVVRLRADERGPASSRSSGAAIGRGLASRGSAV